MTDEQQKHWSTEIRLLRWLMSGVAVLIVSSAGAGWHASQLAGDIQSEVGAQDARIANLEDRYVRHRERMAAIEAVQQADGQAIARIEERMGAQSESLGRIEANVNEVMRHLRRQNGGSIE